MGKYDDIINLPHHVSMVHPRMSMESRAAQFAPFAALSGHNEAIVEMARKTQSKKDLSEIEINIISRKIYNAFEKKLPVKILLFCPDKSKKGGSYKTIEGIIKKIDEFEKTLILKDGQVITMDSICDIL